MPRVFKGWKEASRADWGTNLNSDLENLTSDQVKTGAILRIADAVETIAKDRAQLEKEAAWYKKRYQESQDEIANLNHKISGYKSHITSLKNKLNS